MQIGLEEMVGRLQFRVDRLERVVLQQNNYIASLIKGIPGYTITHEQVEEGRKLLAAMGLEYILPKEQPETK